MCFTIRSKLVDEYSLMTPHTFLIDLSSSYLDRGMRDWEKGLGLVVSTFCIYG